MVRGIWHLLTVFSTGLSGVDIDVSHIEFPSTPAVTSFRIHKIQATSIIRNRYWLTLWMDGSFQDNSPCFWLASLRVRKYCVDLGELLPVFLTTGAPVTARGMFPVNISPAGWWLRDSVTCKRMHQHVSAKSLFTICSRRPFNSDEMHTGKFLGESTRRHVYKGGRDGWQMLNSKKSPSRQAGYGRLQGRRHCTEIHLSGTDWRSLRGLKRSKELRS